MTAKDNVLISKLGTTKGAERSRIWIEGKRLAAAHFTVGRQFIKRWKPGKLVLCAGIIPHDDDECGTVVGKGDKPIIDIVGAKVRAAFPDATHVKVKYDNERQMITITAAEKR